jgi:hypothetical protein
LGLSQIAACPGDQHLGHVYGVGAAGQQVVGIFERDEALGMPGGGEDLAGVLDADDLVAWREEDDQRLPEPGSMVPQLLPGDIVQELFLDPKAPAGDGYLGLALGFDLRSCACEQVTR